MSTFSFYETSVAPLTKVVETLNTVLTKAKAFDSSDKIPSAYIIEDMLPLHHQVRIVYSWIHKMSIRFKGGDVSSWVEPASTPEWEQIFQKVNDTLSELKSLDRDAVNGMVRKPVSVGMGKGKPDVEMEFWQYMESQVLPNMYFHLMTAYNICRKEGVPLGKLDYIMAFVSPILAAKGMN